VTDRVWDAEDIVGAAELRRRTETVIQ
jgi:hypothetical protein